MSRFNSLRVSKKVQETHDSVSISLEIPSELKPMYEYKQGQYLTFEIEKEGKKIRRAYSLCSSPHWNEDLTVTVKKVSNGLMSAWMNDTLKEGDLINVMPPQGKFYTELSSSNQKHYLLLGGGSGITPLMSIIKSVLKVEPNSKCTLLYANKDENNIIFKDKLSQLEADFSSRFKVIHSLDKPIGAWNGNTGLLYANKIISILEKEQINFNNAEVFICGPSALMNEYTLALEKMGVAKDKIHLELFSVPVEEYSKEEKSSTSTATANGSKIKIILDGTETEFIIEDNRTILQAAQDAGLDPPYSCESGICSTCMAKVLEGEVKMDENNILTDDEVKKGYVLTCQAHPTTPVVVIEYFD